MGVLLVSAGWDEQVGSVYGGDPKRRAAPSDDPDVRLVGTTTDAPSSCENGGPGGSGVRCFARLCLMPPIRSATPA